jgi:hypothetical protein
MQVKGDTRRDISGKVTRDQEVGEKAGHLSLFTSNNFTAQFGELEFVHSANKSKRSWNAA